MDCLNGYTKRIDHKLDTVRTTTREKSLFSYETKRLKYVWYKRNDNERTSSRNINHMIMKEHRIQLWRTELGSEGLPHIINYSNASPFWSEYAGIINLVQNFLKSWNAEIVIKAEKIVLGKRSMLHPDPKQVRLMQSDLQKLIKQRWMVSHICAGTSATAKVCLVRNLQRSLLGMTYIVTALSALTPHWQRCL